MTSFWVNPPTPYCPVNEKAGRVYFGIRFSLSEQAQELGAKWDIHERKWYVVSAHPNLDQLLQLSGYHPYYLPEHCNPHEHGCCGCASFRRHS